MTRHLDHDQSRSAPDRSRRHRGQQAYHSGVAAEHSVARNYGVRGGILSASRWRGQSGEIDLIFEEGGVIVFVEVKKARSFDAAKQSLSREQMMRIHAAASEYLATAPQGQLSEVRFDLAMVDDTGAVKIHENAFGHF